MAVWLLALILAGRLRPSSPSRSPGLCALGSSSQRRASCSGVRPGPESAWSVLTWVASCRKLSADLACPALAAVAAWLGFVGRRPLLLVFVRGDPLQHPLSEYFAGDVGARGWGPLHGASHPELCHGGGLVHQCSSIVPSRKSFLGITASHKGPGCRPPINKSRKPSGTINVLELTFPSGELTVPRTDHVCNFSAYSR